MRVARLKNSGRANKRTVPVEGLQHLTTTFEMAERQHPDLMEPYSVRLADAATAGERAELMRAGLRETFRRRYPMPEGFWPVAEARTAEAAVDQGEARA